MLNNVDTYRGKIDDIKNRRLPEARRNLVKAQGNRDSQGIDTWEREIAWLQDLTNELEWRMTSITKLRIKY